MVARLECDASLDAGADAVRGWLALLLLWSRSLVLVFRLSPRFSLPCLLLFLSHDTILGARQDLPLAPSHFFHLLFWLLSDRAPLLVPRFPHFRSSLVPVSFVVSQRFARNLPYSPLVSSRTYFDNCTMSSFSLTTDRMRPCLLLVAVCAAMRSPIVTKPL